MSETHCLRCRKYTADVSPAVVKVSGRNQLCSKCGICGTTKSKFIGKQAGGSAINWVLNNAKLPELHLIDQADNGRIGKVNYCGPFTKLSKRLARGDEGVNALDRECKNHDLAYDKFKDVANRNQADKALANVARKVINDPASTRIQKTNAHLVEKIMLGKVKYGVGAKGSLGKTFGKVKKKRGGCKCK